MLPIRAAIVGCGRISDLHQLGYRDRLGARIVAVCDTKRGRAQQKARATPWMKWMLTILWASKEGPTGGRIPKSFGLRWHPLIVPSPVEVADIGKTRAETDAIRINSNVAEPAEIREQRLVVGDVDGDLRVAPP